MVCCINSVLCHCSMANIATVSRKHVFKFLEQSFCGAFSVRGTIQHFLEGRESTVEASWIEQARTFCRHVTGLQVANTSPFWNTLGFQLRCKFLPG
ncbi:hypothetical protein TNCV_2045821 [Trichonephila clavipes]|uniref:Uncharacterized protein n=1 Tax=Trichonephila clavipes TaxID=2585209 RepID=A0A8X6SRE9_TRICX|nr:hypothetical protein TNCV_2045821 [Trichonephila clavipes]